MNILVLLLILGGKFSVIQLTVWFYLWLFVHVFVMLKNIFLVCWLSYITKSCWILSNYFSASISVPCVFFLYYISEVYYTGWFLYVDQALNYWCKSHLVMDCKPFYVLLDSICLYFVEDICVMFIRNIDLFFSFLWCLCLVLVQGLYWPLRISWKIFPHLLILKWFVKPSCYSCL